ncbi:hypothetical protein O1Q96_18525 [Streptomyces sp. Qhu-G9]|uniref:hypothetical protein n=1 Tax=Streptomyces sp. Qhu-G9 TaxID=3452799 RepID=UPI0022AC8A20|nr:hypothetical protein [Streptomyces aurantiacus]WAU81603.1 hypothetical protein O1Q96_18525 [Streptomyces aurantiacus]
MSAGALRIPRPGVGPRQVRAVAGCCFVASFAAPGLPPFLTEILPEPGAVAAGVAAAAGSARHGPASPVPIGAAVALITVCATVLRSLCTRWSHTCPR